MNDMPIMMIHIDTWKDKIFACWKVIKGDVPAIGYIVRNFYKDSK